MALLSGLDFIHEHDLLLHIPDTNTSKVPPYLPYDPDHHHNHDDPVITATKNLQKLIQHHQYQPPSSSASKLIISTNQQIKKYNNNNQNNHKSYHQKSNEFIQQFFNPSSSTIPTQLINSLKKKQQPPNKTKNTTQPSQQQPAIVKTTILNNNTQPSFPIEKRPAQAFYPIDLVPEHDQDPTENLVHDLNFLCDLLLPQQLPPPSSSPSAAINHPQNLLPLPPVLKPSNRLHVYIRGKGPTAVIMIHGLAMTSNFWRTGILRHLTPSAFKNYTFYCPDLIGYGQSRHVSAEKYFSAEEQAQRVLSDVIEYYKIPNFHLVGHSFGGLVSMRLAAALPVKMVCTINLLSPAYFASKRKVLESIENMPFPSGLIISHPNLMKLLLKFAVSLSHLVTPIALRLVPKAEVPAKALQDFLSSDPDCVLGTVQAVIYQGCEAAVTKLRDRRQKVMHLHGGQDRVVPVEQARLMHVRYENVQWSVVSGGPHHFPLSHAAIVAPFLEAEWLRNETRERGRWLCWPAVVVTDGSSAKCSDVITNDRLRLFGL